MKFQPSLVKKFGETKTREIETGCLVLKNNEKFILEKFNVMVKEDEKKDVLFDIDYHLGTYENKRIIRYNSKNRLFDYVLYDYWDTNVEKIFDDER